MTEERRALDLLQVGELIIGREVGKLRGAGMVFRAGGLEFGQAVEEFL